MTGDHSFPTADPLPEKQDYRDDSEKGVEEEKETETEFKDESGSAANSPHHGTCIYHLRLFHFFFFQIANCILLLRWTRHSFSLSEPEGQTWESIEADPLVNREERDDEYEEEEWKELEREHCSSPSKSVMEEEAPVTEHSNTFLLPQSEVRETAQPSLQSPSSESPVCAKNISLTPSGEKVVLWTRSAPTLYYIS